MLRTAYAVIAAAAAGIFFAAYAVAVIVAVWFITRAL